ncbi:unnamed protein product, partial [Mesorhabditis spiculigera]
MQENLAIVYNAIQVLYSGTNNAEAQQWINAFTKSTDAWMACDQILAERKDPVACYFAAQTLRQKIVKNLKEVPEASLESLRESIINHLTQIHVVDQTSEATSTQLCLAVANLYIQVPVWTNFIAQLLNRFTALSGDRTKMLLTLLKVFPEEVETSCVGENRREAIRQELAMSADSVILYLRTVLEAALQKRPAEEDLIKKVVQCLAALLQNPSIETNNIARSDLIGFVFQILSAPAVSHPLHDAATECIVAGLLRIEDFHKHKELAVILHRAIFALRPVWTATNQEDTDRLQNFTRVFVELTESLIEPVVNQDRDATPLQDIAIFEFLILAAEHFDYALIEMTFNVWYRISEALFMIDDNDHVGQFKPFVVRYLQALAKHSQFDVDEAGLPDQDSDFNDFRRKVRETVKDVAFIVGTDECIKLMFNNMAEAAKNKETWEKTEAALFISSNVIENLLPEEDSVVPELINQLVQLTPATGHPCLIMTAIQFMGGCSEWLAKHPALIDRVMQWLFHYLESPVFVTTASGSIEQICDHAPVVHYVPALITAIDRLEAITTNGKNVEKAAQDLTKAAATLCNHLDREELTLRLRALCDPILMKLQLILDADIPAAADENKGDGWIQMAHRPIIWIDRLAAIFRVIKPYHTEKGAYDLSKPPWLEVAGNTWQATSRCLQKYQANDRLVEHTCRAIRHVVRSLGTHSEPFVQPLILQLMDIYSRHRHSCILYLASILVDEYGATENLRDGLMEMLRSLAVNTFPVLDQEHGFRNHPDTVDDLFRLAHRYITRCPSSFFVHPICQPLFECCLHALHVDHTEASRSVTKYCNEMLNQLVTARRMQYEDAGVKAADELMRTNAGRLLEHALKAGLFDVSSKLLRDFAEIIAGLGKYDAQLQARALSHALGQLPRGPATEAQLAAAHADICRGGGDARLVVGVLRDFVKLYG